MTDAVFTLDTEEIDVLEPSTELIVTPIDQPVFLFDEDVPSREIVQTEVDEISEITLNVPNFLVELPTFDFVFDGAPPAGPRGTPGFGGDAFFEFDQGIAAAVWNVAHNLGKFPSVTVVDSAGTYIDGLVKYIDLNNLRITFNAAFSGVAYMN